MPKSAWFGLVWSDHHGHCILFDGTIGIALYSMIFDGTAWYLMVFVGIQMVLDGEQALTAAPKGSNFRCSSVFICSFRLEISYNYDHGCGHV